ncbi:sensor histidine kinase [Arachnia rubra]|jgi:histidine kinase|uniref:histidine kinase n=1 Tax=Arachnia rubra TaxID=1547448 RepID=A0ABX7Y5E3_9ACTN|nr:sensor histidine kinase [Arachnia rubra]MDO4646534.1 sensor histidine kinase [Propionibacteriaceae bacterium]QUC08425.1 sensor histidine kinase [Arachnia rubra]BCR79806.1 histidine kinase [Arachnia rubra]
MNTTTPDVVNTPASDAPRPRRFSIGRLVGSSLQAVGRFLQLLVMWPLEVATLLLVCVTFSSMALGVGVLLVPVAVGVLRWVATLKRRRVGTWSGSPVESPYLPLSPLKPGFRGMTDRTWALLKDPSTWRDIAWLFMDYVVSAFLSILVLGFLLIGLIPLGAVLLGDAAVESLKGVAFGGVGVEGASFSITFQDDPILAAIVSLLVMLPVTLVCAPRLLRVYNRFARWALGPNKRTRLAARMQQLSRTRQETLESSAAELRRLERDLHDGTQGRLVAMGMTISTAQALMRTDPQAAEALLSEAKDASSKALGELRDLVRGIHPPVLADRGLADAVRALAADCVLPVRVSADIPARCDLAVESAAYFAVSELLTNVVKHAQASRIDVDMWVAAGELRASVTDDGRGGADPGAGSGLRGIERRLAAFDGVLTVNSPAGGPTAVSFTMPLSS